MSFVKTSRSNLRFSQSIVPVVNRGKPPASIVQGGGIVPGYVPATMLAGFGSRAVVKTRPSLTPGKVINNPVISRIQTPVAIRTGVEGVHVLPNPGFDYTQQYVKQLQISLATAFTDQLFYVSGTVLWYLSSTNTTDLIKIRIASINADPIPWQPGNGVEGLPFALVYITVPAPIPGATATLIYFTDTPNKPVRFF